MTNAEIESIPINNRRWSSSRCSRPASPTIPSGFGLLSFRAIQPLLNNVQIDGADDNQAFFSRRARPHPRRLLHLAGAIREFQVNTGVYSAEFGRAVGGVVNSVTKSGTNQLHGELYFYIATSRWSASNPFTTTTAYEPAPAPPVTIVFKPKDKRNQYGFGIGGPIIKDKLFFFYAFDQFRRVFPGTGSAASTSFYAPLTAAQGTTLAASIQSGTKVLTTAAQASTAYNGLIAAANTDLGTTPRIGFQIINTPKLDFQINSKNVASFLYHRLRWDSPGGVQTQSNVFYGKEGFAQDFVKLDYTLAKLDSTINNHLTNEVRYQYGRELNDESPLPNGSFVNQYLTANGNTPQVNINNGSQGFIAGQPYYAFRPALPDERKWQIGDTAYEQLGRHGLRFGLDIVHNYDLQNTLGYSGYSPNGTYNYTSAFAFAQDVLSGVGGGCGTTANGVYTPVGCYSYFHQTVGGTTFDLATVDYGFFVQDDLKLSSRLTLNLGARYDYESIPGQQANLVVANFAPSANTISDKNNISPRLGFAWDPFGLGKTTVRGGFGFYYGRIPNVNILGARFASGAPAGQLSYNIPSPTAVGAPLLPKLPASFAGQTPDIQYIDSHLQNPYTEQFDFAVQQDLGQGTILSLSYLGALGRELPNSLNLNVDPANAYTVNYTVLAGTDGTCGPLACGAVIPVKAYGQRRNGSSASINKNPAYGAVYAGLSNVNANYHAATVEVTKRANQFVSFDINYTWSHALDYNQTSVTGFSSNNFFDPYGNPRANYGNSYLDVRHRAVGWAILNLPGTKGHRFVDGATNGWSIKPALQVQSGLPYSAVVNGTTAPPQCTIAGCLQAVNSGLSGLAVPTAYIPAVGRNTYNYPRDLVVDLRIQKDFKLGERFSLQFIGESFNVANFQNITSLVTTAYTVASTSTATTSAGTLTWQPHTATGGFGYANSANSNFAYSPRNIQAGARLFF